MPPASVKNWVTEYTTCIRSKFGHQVAPLALLGSKVGHQVVDVTRIATLLWNALSALSVGIELIVSIELVSSSARVTSVKSATVRENRTHRSDPRDTWVR